MKKSHKKLVVFLSGILICTLLTGCTIGEYSVFDFYVDENGNQHFMLFGQHGGNSDGEELEEETSSEEAGDAGGIEDSTSSEEAGDAEGIEDGTSSEEAGDRKEKENDSDWEDIVGTSLKRGWTSEDNSILKGIDVSVKGDSVLFSINLKQDKEVTITYDIVLDSGEYQLAYTSPDSTEQVLLHDGKIIQSEEKVLFKQGRNEITIVSDNAIFKKINISVTGIEVSDFEE